jgi:hypothetical protein
VRFDSLKLGEGAELVELKGIAFTGSTLSRDEVGALLDRETPADQRTALAARLKAASGSIAEIVVGDRAKGPLTFTGLRAESIDRGKIRRLTLAGGKGGPTINGETASFQSGAMTIDEIDLSTVLASLTSGSIAMAKPTVARLSWNGFEASFPDKDVAASAPGGNTIKVRLGAFDGQSVYEGGLPVKSSAALRNLVLEFPKASEIGAKLAEAGKARSAEPSPETSAPPVVAAERVALVAEDMKAEPSSRVPCTCMVHTAPAPSASATCSSYGVTTGR